MDKLILFLCFIFSLAGCGGGGSGDVSKSDDINLPPIANAGADLSVKTSSLVNMAGGGSDADDDLLSYAWAFTSMPSGSEAILSDSGIANPSFTADLDGTYVLSLTVNDGNGGCQGSCRLC